MGDTWTLEVELSQDFQTATITFPPQLRDIIESYPRHQLSLKADDITVLLEATTDDDQRRQREGRV